MSYCSKKCGAPSIRMEEVDKAAVDYLHKLLSPENQDKIAAALRQYQAGEKNRVEDFNKALQKRIEAKQGEYDALMKNLATGALPPAVVADIGEQKTDRVPIREQLKRAAAEILHNPAHKKERVKEAAHEDR